MTYFEFLFRFLCIPIIALLLVSWFDWKQGRKLPKIFTGFSPFWTIVLNIIIALLYTTPWDNYLVATNVWWYDPRLVSGIIIGWVPIEEYTFFILQPIMTALWLLFLAKRMKPGNGPLYSYLRYWSTAVVAILWLIMLIIMFSSWDPGTYLALELSWALFPIALQLLFGADILFRHWKLVLATIIPTTIYLSAADAIAIGVGTWTIDPAQSLNIFIGVLPIEEFIFFLLTNTLLTFSVVLILSTTSHDRILKIKSKLIKGTQISTHE